MTAEEINEWADKGPWGVVGEGEGYAIVAGNQREDCDSIEDAFGRAARYNRSIAQRHQEAAEPDRIAQEIANQETEAALAVERGD